LSLLVSCSQAPDLAQRPRLHTCKVAAEKAAAKQGQGDRGVEGPPQGGGPARHGRDRSCADGSTSLKAGPPHLLRSQALPPTVSTPQSRPPRSCSRLRRQCRRNIGQLHARARAQQVSGGALWSLWFALRRATNITTTHIRNIGRPFPRGGMISKGVSIWCVEACTLTFPPSGLPPSRL
jgi:hypothetical protein